MYRLIIAAYGDNEPLHRLALQQAVEAVKRVNGAPVYRAYLEKVEDSKIVGLSNGPSSNRSSQTPSPPSA